jgi:group I intron endonuclease
MSGVYYILNLVNYKSYVGSTVCNFNKRWNQHRSQLRQQKHHSQKLQAAWNKYGETNFVFKVLERCLPKQCVEREQYYLDRFKAVLCGYNICAKAGSSLGRRHSVVTRNKISLSNRGNTNSRGEKHPRARLIEAEVVIIKQLLKDGYPPRIIAQEFGVSRGSISAIKGGRSWSFVKI